MQYSIIYETIIYDEEKGIFIFRPEAVAKGKEDKQNHIFEDHTTGLDFTILDSFDIKNQRRTYVGESLPEQELLLLYPNAENLQEAIDFFLAEKKKYILIGKFQNKKLLTVEILLDEFSINLIQNDERNLDDSGYQELRNQCSQGDITFLLKEELELLLKDTSLEQIRNHILQLMNHKETYKEKIKGKHSIYVLDYLLQDMMCECNLDEIKNYLKENLEKLKSNEDVTKYLTLEEFYFDMFYRACDSKSIIDIKEILIVTLVKYQTIIELIGNLELTNDEYDHFYKILSIQCVTIQKILEYNDMNQILIDYENLVNSSMESISKISEKLEQSRVYLKITNPNQMMNTLQPQNHLEDDSIKEKLNFNYLKTYEYMTSKLIDRNSQIDAILSTICMVDNNPNPDKKQACLIVGMPGSGKTQTFVELKKSLPNRPVVIVDTNQITEQGYVGGSIENTILEELLNEAHAINEKEKTNKSEKITGEDIVLAQHGIVFLDEIDKRRENITEGADVNGKGVVDQILKLMDGTIYKVNVGGNVFSRQMVRFDSSNLVIFAGGAFEEYFELQDKKMGYQSNITKQEEFSKYLEVNPEDLVKYGLSSQFIGRCNRAVLYPKHTKQSLLQLENNKYTSNIENKKILFKQHGIDLVWDCNFLDKVSEEALKLKKGARGLNHIISRCLDNAYSEIKKYPGCYKIIYLDPNMISNPGEVILIKNDGSIIKMQDIVKRNEVSANEKYHMSQVQMDLLAYQKALFYIENKITSSNENNPKTKVLSRNG